MTIHWLPTSGLGRIALWLAGGFLALVVLNVVVQLVTEPSGDDRTWLDLGLVWLAIAAALAAAAVALVAVWRDRDRAVLTFAALVPALFVLVFEGGERVL